MAHDKTYLIARGKYINDFNVSHWHTSLSSSKNIKYVQPRVFSKMKGLLLVLIFAAAKQSGILGRTINDEITSQQMINQTPDIKMRINQIKDLATAFGKNITETLTQNITTELEKHSIVLTAEEFFNYHKRTGSLPAECKSVYNSQYNKVKINISNKLFRNITKHYREKNQFLTNIIKNGLEDFEKGKSQPTYANDLQVRINEAFKMIDSMKKEKHEVLNETLNYLHGDECYTYLHQNFYLPFMKCLKKY
ncbi:uncharacterized protein LOC131663945 [Phymastichus coffea]|uniref:uncharacterized protein LOC131663945 n=1 Tax=Phymastichus coffea TaxID=108790 RepID=UPI00273AA222|nr:uncharacterized protein LOC131663945 [Phymastichus coffea]